MTRNVANRIVLVFSQSNACRLAHIDGVLICTISELHTSAQGDCKQSFPCETYNICRILFALLSLFFQAVS